MLPLANESVAQCYTCVLILLHSSGSYSPLVSFFVTLLSVLAETTRPRVLLLRFFFQFFRGPPGHALSLDMRCRTALQCKRITVIFI